MEPLQPMEPLAPLPEMKSWWDPALGHPDSAGGQDEVQYAYFAGAKRLLIRTGERVATYDTGTHRIFGVAQSADASHPRFTSDAGVIDLASLTRL